MFLPVTCEDIDKAMEADPTIDVIYLTSPNYEGLSTNYAKIRAKYHDKPFIVDEAHGAHFYFNSKMPIAALPGGADIVTNSVHKSLGGLNATALIHVSKNSLIDANVVKDAYHLLNTTSPSPLILADTECCVAAMVNEGEAKLNKAIYLNSYFRERI
jgi:arginine decarboxylase